jgi:hypothetical protein
VFKALLSHSEEVAKSCTYKYSVPWFGSSIGLAEGKSTCYFLADALTAQEKFIDKKFSEHTNTGVEISCDDSVNGKFLQEH